MISLAARASLSTQPRALAQWRPHPSGLRSPGSGRSGPCEVSASQPRQPGASRRRARGAGRGEVHGLDANSQEDQTHWRALLQEPCADIKYALASGTAGAALALSNYPDRGEAASFLCQMPIGLALQTLGAMHPAMAAGYLGGVFERAPEAAVHMFGKIAPAEAGSFRSYVRRAALVRRLEG